MLFNSWSSDRISPPMETEMINILTRYSVAQSVKDDLAILKASPLIRKELLEHSHGFVLDIKTGVITSV